MRDRYIGVPVVIGAKGVERIIEIELDKPERQMFDPQWQTLNDSCEPRSITCPVGPDSPSVCRAPTAKVEWQPNGNVDADFVPDQIFLGLLQSDLDEVRHVAPIEIRFDVAGFEPSHAQQVADQPVETPGGFLDLRHHGGLKLARIRSSGVAQAAGGARNRRDRGSDFMRNRVEQGLA